MQQQAAAVHMAQKIMAKANTLGRALDQARNVGGDKACLWPHAHHTQYR